MLMIYTIINTISCVVSRVKKVFNFLKKVNNDILYITILFRYNTV